MKLTSEQSMEKLTEFLRLLKEGEEIVVNQDDEGRLVIFPVPELEWEASALSRNRDFMTYLDACQAEGDVKGSTSIEVIKRRLSEQAE